MAFSHRVSDAVPGGIYREGSQVDVQMVEKACDGHVTQSKHLREEQAMG